MKKIIFLLASLLIFSVTLIAQDSTNKSNTIPKSDDKVREEEYDALQTKVEIIIPKEQHVVDSTASVKIEYEPMYDQVRIYYECMYVTYNREEAVATILQCLNDFQKEHKYFRYKYLKDDKERFFKDEKGKIKTQYVSTVKFSR